MTQQYKQLCNRIVQSLLVNMKHITIKQSLQTTVSNKAFNHQDSNEEDSPLSKNNVK